jgi:hypothetical protein
LVTAAEGLILNLGGITVVVYIVNHIQNTHSILYLFHIYKNQLVINSYDYKKLNKGATRTV